MRTRNSYFPDNSSATIPGRRNKRRTPNVVEPELRTIVEMGDNRTMEELLQAPTEVYGEAIVISEINTDHFDIKTNLLQLVQANPYHGFEREKPHTHINNFKRITSNLKFRDVPNDVIKLMMFSYSLKENARVWYNKEPPNSILTWDDLVNKFMNQFFPPSKTTYLKNEISRFTQRFEETFGEALNDLRKCLERVPTTDLRSGNLLRKTTREALQIIENKSKVRYSRNKPNVSRMNTTSRENATMQSSQKWHLFSSAGELSSLAVGTSSGSGNLSLVVGMPYAFYSQQSSHKLDAPYEIKVDLNLPCQGASASPRRIDNLLPPHKPLQLGLAASSLSTSLQVLPLRSLPS
nr:hypothetical protein [Tanacetum cinerariifolium]